MKTFARWISVTAILLFASFSTAQAEQPDVILEWNQVAIDANAIDHTGPDLPGDQLSATQGPPASARVLAIVHAAMFDAYNSIDRRYTPYYVQVDAAKGASKDAAVAQAAHDTLSALYPHIADYFDAALEETLERVASAPARAKGIVVGEIVAAEILELREDDGAADYTPYVPVGAPGFHDVDPLNAHQSFISPHFGGVTPFTIPDITVFRAAPPPALTSGAYTLAFNEVKALGGDGIVTPSARTMDETVIAYYWSYNGSPLMGTPPRLYNQIARVIAQQEKNKVHENARLFALLNLAMADGGISAWDTKYHYEYWRPIRGIREAATDANPDTSADPIWSPLGASRSNPVVPYPGEKNFTPPFPAYTSGHATFGAAVFKTLANFYQTDDISFTFVSDEWNGETVDQFGVVRPLIPRSFASLSQATAENAASRTFNGVHWRFDGTEGVRAGNGIADFIFENYLLPNGPAPQAIPDADFESQIDAYLTGNW